jgi:hypothetical protein
LLVLTIGTQASASTWVFNVVRKIFAIHRPWALSNMGEHGGTALTSLGRGTKDAVFKVHFLDQAMANLLLLADSKVIVTHRDCRDVIVSNDQRFGMSHQDTIRSLSRTLTDILALPTDLQTLHLNYEDGFASKLQTVQEIADFIGLPIDGQQASLIHADLAPRVIKNKISEWMMAHPELAESDWDRTTQWHPNHLGDGLVGKWREQLPADISLAAVQSLAPFYRPDWQSQHITWKTELFLGQCGALMQPIVDLEISGEEKMLCWGPYLNLPVGRWRFKPLIKNLSTQKISVKADVATFAAGVGIINMNTFTLPSSPSEPPALYADISDHRHTIEVRLQSLADGRKGSIRFEGVEIEYLGETEKQPNSTASSVVDAS